ncbi:MAG: ATP-dependent metalloprotease, partial [Dokdonella sp.]
RDMVTKYGLSEELGPMTYAEEEDEVFLGRSVTQHKHVSEETARKIDAVVRGVIDRAYQRAREILTTNMDKLEKMAGALLQYETIDREQIAAIMDGREPNPPKDWTNDSKPGSGSGGAKPRGESPIGGPAVQPRVRSD